MMASDSTVSSDASTNSIPASTSLNEEEDPTSWKQKGVRAFQDRKYDESKTWFLKIVEHDYSNFPPSGNKLKFLSQAHNWLGRIYEEQYKYQEALREYSVAIDLYPSFDIPYYNRGALHVDLGNYEQALGDYAKSIELAPVTTGGWNNRGCLLKDIFKQYEKSIYDFDQAIKINPSAGHCYLHKAEAFLLLGQLETAKQELLKAQEINKNLVLAYYVQGYMCMMEKNYSEALKFFQKFLKHEKRYYSKIQSAKAHIKKIILRGS